jgi:hypothetical protein
MGKHARLHRAIVVTVVILGAAAQITGRSDGHVATVRAVAHASSDAVAAGPAHGAMPAPVAPSAGPDDAASASAGTTVRQPGSAALARIADLPRLRLPASAAAWVAPGEGRHTIDDFEAATWPDPSIWPLVSDLTGSADGEYLWATSKCHAAHGEASLRADGGGAAGAGLSCGAPYPAAQQTSAVLALDLSGLHSAGKVDLAFDVWADADWNEGLFINHLVFGPDGTLVSRRVVYSATGRVGAWATDVRLDLTDLRDAQDPSWHMDLRGRRAYLELAFLSAAGTSGGEGIYVDGLALVAEARAPIVVTPVPPTATPPPVDRQVACGREPECKTIVVQAFDDYGCDGRYRRGLDFPLRGATRIDIVAGSEVLGATLGTSDTLYFRVPMTGDARVSVVSPPGYRLCPGLANPRTVEPSDFGRKDTVKVVFGHYHN